MASGPCLAGPQLCLSLPAWGCVIGKGKAKGARDSQEWLSGTTGSAIQRSHHLLQTVQIFKAYLVFPSESHSVEKERTQQEKLTAHRGTPGFHRLQPQVSVQLPAEKEERNDGRKLHTTALD